MIRTVRELIWLAMHDPEFADNVQFVWWPQAPFVTKKHKHQGIQWIQLEVALPALGPIISGQARHRYLFETGLIRPWLEDIWGQS